MKVKKIMTKDVGTCHASESLAKAVSIMWQRDCGIVPVVSDSNSVMGMITDRDVAIAITSRNRPANEVLIDEVIKGQTISCAPDDSVQRVLKKMRKHKIKRLPVVKKTGELVGMVSIADVLNAKRNKAIQRQLIKTLESISKPASILLKEI